MASRAAKLRIVISEEGATCEDVFVSKAPDGSHGSDALVQRGVGYGHASFQPIALLPMDAEACLAEGVDPHDLYDRQLDDFKELGLDPQISLMVRMTSCALVL